MKTWKTREGEVIEIKKMTDTHLLNTIKMIERKVAKGFKVVRSYGYDPDNDFETGEVEFIEGKEALLFYTEYKDLVTEAKRRYLNENMECACGGIKSFESDFCKECI